MVYRYTSYPVNLVFNSQIYTSLVIKHTRIEVSTEEEVSTVEIELPSTNVVASKYVKTVPGQETFISIQKTHLQEVASGGEYIVEFDGFVSTAQYDGIIGCKLHCKPITAVFRHAGPRYKYMTMCNHTLYDARCKVDPDSYRFNGTINGVSGSVVTIPGVSSFGANFFLGGYIACPVSTGTDYRMILEQTGDDLRILLPFSEEADGKAVSVFAGCPHSVSACEAKFNNVVNFGGFPHIPTKNPFTTELR